jgi:hypothetical protein
VPYYTDTVARALLFALFLTRALAISRFPLLAYSHNHTLNCSAARLLACTHALVHSGVSVHARCSRNGRQLRIPRRSSCAPHNRRRGAPSFRRLSGRRRAHDRGATRRRWMGWRDAQIPLERVHSARRAGGLRGPSPRHFTPYWPSGSRRFGR